jgi:hypothetical protein
MKKLEVENLMALSLKSICRPVINVDRDPVSIPPEVDGDQSCVAGSVQYLHGYQHYYKGTVSQKKLESNANQS